MDQEEKIHKEFLAQWQVAIDDIRYAKNKQWNIGYYGLLIQAGIIGFIKLLKLENNKFLQTQGYLFLIISILALIFISILLIA